MDPGTRRNRKGLCATLAAENAVNDLVNSGVPGQPTAHSVVGIHAKDFGLLRKSDRVASDSRAQIDDDSACEAIGLMAGDNLAGGLLKAHGVKPHPIAKGEFRLCSFSAGGQAKRGGNGTRGR
jgi:hypothetical protein